MSRTQHTQKEALGIQVMYTITQLDRMMQSDTFYDKKLVDISDRKLSISGIAIFNEKGLDYLPVECIKSMKKIIDILFISDDIKRIHIHHLSNAIAEKLGFDWSESMGVYVMNNVMETIN